jgi:hypothetical protein
MVGEGEAEKAFLQHLKSIYGTGDPKVTIKSAGGKGPQNIITEAISTKDCNGYDRSVALLETDLEWPASLVKRAQGKKIELLGSSPCLEGFLLDILGEGRPTPNTSSQCKTKFNGLLTGKSTDKNSYSELFTKEVLDKVIETSENLEKLVNYIQGK